MMYFQVKIELPCRQGFSYSPRLNLSSALKSPSTYLPKGSFLRIIGATGFEPRVALYLLPYPASVGSTDARNAPARCFGVVGPVRLGDAVTATVTARHAHPGETVEVVAKSVTIADLNRVRIEAEVHEYDSGRVALGAEVRITAEGFERASWLAKVEEIPDSVVPGRIRSEDPGRLIEARVMPVKIAFAESTPLKLGQRVEIEIPADELGSAGCERANRRAMSNRRLQFPPTGGKLGRLSRTLTIPRRGGSHGLTVGDRSRRRPRRRHPARPGRRATSSAATVDPRRGSGRRGRLHRPHGRPPLRDPDGPEVGRRRVPRGLRVQR